MTPKQALAKALFEESLVKVDHELRTEAKHLECLDELIEWRDLTLELVKVHQGPN